MKSLLTYFLLFAVSFISKGQCPTGNVTLLTQSQVNSFGTNYPNCTTLTGNLDIHGVGITSLSTLPPLVTINGFLVIDSTSIVNLSGLESLQTIGYLFYVRSNPSLDNFDGLSNIELIKNYVRIEDNGSLIDLSGLSSLDSLGNSILISKNPFLQNLTGLEGIENVANDIIISHNNLLSSLAGLDNLHSAGSLSVVSNPLITSLDPLLNLSSAGSLDFSGLSITSMSGLNNLTTVGQLTITSNPNLISLAGLESLEEINNTQLSYGLLSLHENAALSSLDGLQNLTLISKALYLYNCPQLSDMSGFEHLSKVGKLYILADSVTNLLALQNLDTVFGDFTLRTSSTLEGLNNLKYIGGDVELGDYASFSGLEGLTRIGGDLTISGNPYITDLSGFDNLVTIVGDLTIGTSTPGLTSLHNPNLTSLHGLESLTSVGGNLSVGRFNNLSNLNGLESLDTVGGSFNIFSNNSPSGIENLDYVGLDFSVDVNSDLSVFENLTYIGGMFNVSGRVTSLNGLGNLTTIGGDFRILGDSLLQNLDGLDNLAFIGGKVIIGSSGNPYGTAVNTSLTNINGLDNVNTIVGDIYIKNNPVLTEIIGFNGTINSINNIIINSNPSLTTINCFNGALNMVTGGDIEVSNNINLEIIESFQKVESVDRVYLNGNKNVSVMDAFENLKTAHSINLQQLDSLAAVSGFDSLTSVVLLSIVDNDKLSALTGFKNLNGTGIELIHIQYNPLLSSCSILPLCNLFATGGIDSVDYVAISNNAVGCNSLEEAEQNCASLVSYISGQVYIDHNCNDTLDITDNPLNSKVIRRNGIPSVYTDVNGSFFKVLSQANSFVFSVDAIEGFTLSPNSYDIVTPPDATIVTFTGSDFRFCPDSIFSDLVSSIASLNPPRPGFTNSFDVCYTNQGTEPETANLSFVLLGDAEPFSTILEANEGTIVDSTISWLSTNLPPFQQVCFTVVTQMLPTTPLGLTLYAQSATELLGATDINPLNNNYYLAQTVVGSFDPNDKTVDQTNVDVTTIAEGTKLSYTVRFQNTGTFPATFIEVTDTLQPTLDILTLQPISASHPYILTVQENNILKFRFDDINLPDSTSDEVGSHGYIKFSINSVPGLSLNDVISNSAAIYFDYNEPVITNTAQTLFYTFPTSQSNTITMLENDVFVFNTSHFLFNDEDGDQLTKIHIVEPPLKGQLQLNGIPINGNTDVLATEIAQLSYTPNPDESGNGYTFFTFSVFDGLVYSQDSYGFSINVDTLVYYFPTSQSVIIEINEDSTYTFSPSDFPFADGDGDQLSKIRVIETPVLGQLKLNGVSVEPNADILTEDISLLTYTPDANEFGISYASFDFLVHDGQVFSVEAYTCSFNVDEVVSVVAAQDNLFFCSPNPVNNELHIFGTRILQSPIVAFAIFNIHGQMFVPNVVTSENQTHHTVLMATYPPGMYYLQIVTKDITQIIRVVKI